MNVEVALGLTEQAIEGQAGALLKLKELLKDELTLGNAKRIGGNTAKHRLQVAKKIILQNIKDNKQLSTHGCWYDGLYQYITDTYFIARLTNHIPELQEIPSNIEKLKNCESFFRIKDDYKLTEILNIKDLKLQLKFAKAELKAQSSKKKDIVATDNGLVPIKNAYCDIRILVPCMEILGCDKIEIYANDSSSSILYLKCENGEAVICPININVVNKRKG